MKRIKAACLLQTIHFQLKEDLPREEAVRSVQEEYARYKAQLDRNRVCYRITEETPQPDGSILVKIRRQYNAHDCGEYLEL